MMDKLENAFYEKEFEIKFLRAKGNAFQSLFNDLMGRAYKSDYMPCRPWGRRGDQKNDGFLKSDSHLFDGVDGRQVISALRVGAETAQELGFQYIVTMNEDDAFKEKEDGFDLKNYVLPIKITDAIEDGGLFGIRFD